MTFEAPPGVDLKLESLESRRAGIELRAVAQVPGPDAAPARELATVFIPIGKVAHFLGRFQQYATADTRTGKPKNRELVDRIEEIHLATARALWTDLPDEFPPDDAETSWEVWLRRDDGRELARLEAVADGSGMVVSQRRLAFDDRTVCLVRASARQISAALVLLPDVAELRKAKTGSAFFVSLTPEEQQEWADDLLNRLTPPGEDAPAVCILDTGVTHLLRQQLSSLGTRDRQ